MARAPAHPDSLKEFFAKHWPWVAGFVSAVAVLQYQMQDEKAARRELEEKHEALAKVVSEERDTRRDLSTAVAGLVTSTTDDKRAANAALDRLAGTLGTIRDSLLVSGGASAPPMVAPLAPRRGQ